MKIKISVGTRKPGNPDEGRKERGWCLIEKIGGHARRTHKNSVSQGVWRDAIANGKPSQGGGETGEGHWQRREPNPRHVAETSRLHGEETSW